MMVQKVVERVPDDEFFVSSLTSLCEADCSVELTKKIDLQHSWLLLGGSTAFQQLHYQSTVGQRWTQQSAIEK